MIYGIEDAKTVMEKHGVFFRFDPVVCIVERAETNRRGVFDDKIYWITENRFSMFQGNADPSRYRKGWGFGREKGMASIMACPEGQHYIYKRGWHYGSVPHKAFRQHSNVWVQRDGTKGPYKEWGQFGVNMHKAGASGSTSSLGCITVPVQNWLQFRDHGYALLDWQRKETFPLIMLGKVA